MVAQRLALAAIAAIACLGATDATATVITGKFSGVINVGTDYQGVFGPAQAKLDGLPYFATFTYDTSKGHRSTAPGLDEVSGGAFIFEDTVFGYALTINGVTDDVDVSGQSFVATVDGHDFRLGGAAKSGNGNVLTEMVSGASFANLDHPASFADTFVGVGGAVQKVRGPGQLVYFVNFDNERVDFLTDDDGSTDSVPEPAGWAFLVTGFGAAGASLRGRRALRLRRIATAP